MPSYDIFYKLSLFHHSFSLPETLKTGGHMLQDAPTNPKYRNCHRSSYFLQ